MHSENHKKIYIIGAGISGLVTALVLENNGFSPTIIEASDNVGGRIKTDVINGYHLDHGFQVLLTAYPAAKKYLDYESLELQKFLPGSVIFDSGSASIIGDGLRTSSLLIPTFLSTKVTLADKLRILKLNTKLKKKSLEAIFSDTEISTIQYLKEFGFSQKAIRNFFTPFFSGIFLETELTTSSRMFEFVYKMFGEGFAALPKSGIGEIPKQLKSKLKSTQFIFNTKVSSVEGNIIKLENSNILNSDITIIATDTSKIISSSIPKKTAWKSCQTLYFEIDKRIIEKPLIGLVSDADSLINNIFYHSSLSNNNTNNKELLSVTVVKNHNLHELFLIKKITNELENLCGIKDVTFIKMYDIPKALPNKKELSYKPSLEKITVNKNIILAGDHLCNGSLNAAMLSGELAAQTAIKKLRD